MINYHNLTMWSCFIVLFINIYLKKDKGNSMTRAIVLVIDSFGIGYSADAEEFGFTEIY